MRRISFIYISYFINSSLINYRNINYYILPTFITATGTRFQVKKNNQTLLPYTIITNSLSRISSQNNSVINSTFPLNANIMADPTLLAKARKARFDDLPNFSEHPSEDLERFLKCIKNITKANDESSNHEILEIVRGKLTQSAGLWFDNNEHNFRTWSDFEIQFRTRYFSTTMNHTKFDKLKQRIQLPDEPVTSYIDDVINLCREIDSHMSDSIIIQHLMSGLNPDFRKEISRRESCMNTLSEFFKYAKIEQDLYDTFEKSRHLTLESRHSNFTYNHTTIPSLTAMIKQPKQHYQIMKMNDPIRHNTSMQRSVFKRNSDYSPESQSTFTSNKQIPMKLAQKPLYTKYSNDQSTFQYQFNNCKICGRQNHRTIDCFRKRTTGCFNCGQNHIVRDFTMPPNFQ
ncbi:unnamed protein product [Rotaria magnacalcarata]|uniref:Retrotransposon gag domain-containing protein n=6 Tax=Rotaria magnacalcarata TaxID=392030 RepID=A0A815SZE2_9BILA|nr:unnamed protein product [Rotaria magnacalcarata]